MKIYKYIITPLILILLNFNLSSQTVFSKLVDVLYGIEYGSKMLIKDNNYHIVGRGVLRDSTDKVIKKPDYFTIIDSNRNTKNSFIFKNSFISAPGRSMVIDSDTVYIFGKESPTISEDPIKWNIYKFNLEGDSLDMILYDKFEEKQVFAEKMIIKNNYIYLAGRTWNGTFSNIGTEIVLIKMDKKGNEIKQERFLNFANPNHENKSANILNDMIETKDGNFVIGTLQTNHVGKRVGICKFNNNLDTIWTKYLPYHEESYSDWPKLSPAPDTGIYVNTSWYCGLWGQYCDDRDTIGQWPILTYKLSKNGQIEWTDTIFTHDVPEVNVSPRNFVSKIITAKNGDIIGVGETEEVIAKPNHRAWMFRYSPEGKLKWQHYYFDRQFRGSTFFLNVQEADNGDIICLGNLAWNQGPAYNDSYTWLVRLDSNGCYVPGCLTDSLSEVLTSIPDEIVVDGVKKIEIFPNPSRSSINFKVPNDFKVQSWKILDIQGNRIKSGMANNKYNFENIKISKLNKGIYFFIASNKEGQIGIGEFIKN